VTSPCALDQLSVVHSQPDGRKEEGQTDNAKTNSLPRYASRQKFYLSTMYI